jgi:membrane-bound ClpP family serine protease
MFRLCFRPNFPAIRRGATAWAVVALMAWTCVAADPPQGETEVRSPRTGRLIRVPLPLTASESKRVGGAIDRLAQTLPAATPRPVIVLEFYEKEAEKAADSEFEAALQLARRVAKISQAQTVAFAPVSLKGHAVLVALACEEIYMSEEAEIGAAGAREERIDRAHRGGYQDIAESHKTIPWPLVLGMLDRQTRVVRAVTDTGSEFVLSEDLEKLRKEKLVRSETEVVKAGQLGVFKAREGREYGFVKLLAPTRDIVARALDLSPGTLVEDPSNGGEWKTALISIHGPINPRSVERVRQMINDQVAAGVNFVCLSIDSPGGEPSSSVDLANFISGLNASEVRTVAYIANEARADAALVAVACNQLVMSPKAALGGFGAYNITKDDLENLRVPIREKLARNKARSWSLIEGLVDPGLELHRYVRRGDKADVVDYFSQEELQALPDSARWQKQEQVTTPGKPLELDGERAKALGLATHTATSLSGLAELYQIDGPLTEIEPNWALSLIEALGHPRLAWLLVLIGIGAMYIELHTPGLGVGGFVSMVCFLLFFWSQFLNGTAGWLEALLFLAGAFCLALEVFVMPGVGIFGFGGGALMLASLVLASQTFVLPSLDNDYQLQKFQQSLMTVGGALAAFVVAAVLLRKYLPKAPILGHMMLEPPSGEELERLQQRETMVDLSFLAGQRGFTTTRLNPAGIARFGDELIHVVSDGDLIPRDREVVVVEAHGSKVVVREVG